MDNLNNKNTEMNKLKFKKFTYDKQKRIVFENKNSIVLCLPEKSFCEKYLTPQDCVAKFKINFDNNQNYNSNLYYSEMLNFFFFLKDTIQNYSEKKESKKDDRINELENEILANSNTEQSSDVVGNDTIFDNTTDGFCNDNVNKSKGKEKDDKENQKKKKKSFYIVKTQGAIVFIYVFENILSKDFLDKVVSAYFSYKTIVSGTPQKKKKKTVGDFINDSDGEYNKIRNNISKSEKEKIRKLKKICSKIKDIIQVMKNESFNKNLKEKNPQFVNESLDYLDIFSLDFFELFHKNTYDNIVEKKIEKDKNKDDDIDENSDDDNDNNTKKNKGEDDENIKFSFNDKVEIKIKNNNTYYVPKNFTKIEYNKMCKDENFKRNGYYDTDSGYDNLYNLEGIYNVSGNSINLSNYKYYVFPHLPDYVIDSFVFITNQDNGLFQDYVNTDGVLNFIFLKNYFDKTLMYKINDDDGISNIQKKIEKLDILNYFFKNTTIIENSGIGFKYIIQSEREYKKGSFFLKSRVSYDVQDESVMAYMIKFYHEYAIDTLSIGYFMLDIFMGIYFGSKDMFNFEKAGCHLNYIISGNAQIGKSHLIQQLDKTLPKGMISFETDASDKNAFTNSDQSMKCSVKDEMPPCLANVGNKKMTVQERTLVSRLNEILTSNQTTYNCFELDPVSKKRKAVKHYTSHHSSQIILCNGSLGKSPTSTRFVQFYPFSDNKTEERIAGSNYKRKENQTFLQQVVDFLNFMVIKVNIAISVGAIRSVETNLFDPFVIRFNNILKKNKELKDKATIRNSNAARQLAIQLCIHEVVFSLYIDKNGVFCGLPFHWNQMITIEKLLYLKTDHIIQSMKLLSPQWIDPVLLKVKNYFSNEYAKLRKIFSKNIEKYNEESNNTIDSTSSCDESMYILLISIFEFLKSREGEGVSLISTKRSHFCESTKQNQIIDEYDLNILSFDYKHSCQTQVFQSINQSISNGPHFQDFEGVMKNLGLTIYEEKTFNPIMGENALTSIKQVCSLKGPDISYKISALKNDTNIKFTKKQTNYVFFDNTKRTLNLSIFLLKNDHSESFDEILRETFSTDHTDPEYVYKLVNPLDEKKTLYDFHLKKSKNILKLAISEESDVISEFVRNCEINTDFDFENTNSESDVICDEIENTNSVILKSFIPKKYRFRLDPFFKKYEEHRIERFKRKKRKFLSNLKKEKKIECHPDDWIKILRTYNIFNLDALSEKRKRQSDKSDKIVEKDFSKNKKKKSNTT